MTDSHAAQSQALDPKHCLWPQWRVAPRVRAFVTTRAGGVSEAPYEAARRKQAV